MLGKVKKELAKKYRYWLMMDDRFSGLGMTIHDVSMEVALECQTEHGDSGWVEALQAKKEHIKSRYLSAIEFGARQTKKGVSAKIWGVRKVYRGAFIGSGRNSGKQLVFKKPKRNPKRIEALHGASLPREFERQGMAKLFNKKIKTRFPILFKRALDFHLMKARGRL
jgi:hypothetical protein